MSKLASGEKAKKCYTNWKVFEEAKLYPQSITCQDYLPYHDVDMSCHTRLQLKAEAIIPHLQPEHQSGGGFALEIARQEGKVSALWRSLEDAGVEIKHIICAVCSKEVQLNARGLLAHEKAHQGNSRRATKGGLFYVTLGMEPNPDLLDEVEAQQ